jgi:hypothetical protein
MQPNLVRCSTCIDRLQLHASPTTALHAYSPDTDCALYAAAAVAAQVIVDPATGRSKGYGFVRFANEAERDKSLEMQGYQLSNRPIRVSLATARRSPSAGMPGTHPAELDPTNTTLFIGGLSAGVSEEELRAIFVRYGDVVYTKIPQGKGCGFVQFVNRPDAEAAMAEMNGQMVGSSAIRISWGRSTSRTAILQAQQRPAPGALAAFGGSFAPAGYAAAPGTLVDPYAGVAAAPAGLAPAGGMYAAAAQAPAGMYGIAAGGAVYGGVPALSAGFATGAGDAAQYVLTTTQVGWQARRCLCWHSSSWGLEQCKRSQCIACAHATMVWVSTADSSNS